MSVDEDQSVASLNKLRLIVAVVGGVIVVFASATASMSMPLFASQALKIAPENFGFCLSVSVAVTAIFLMLVPWMLRSRMAGPQRTLAAGSFVLGISLSLVGWYWKGHVTKSKGTMTVSLGPLQTICLIVVMTTRLCGQSLVYVGLNTLTQQTAVTQPISSQKAAGLSNLGARKKKVQIQTWSNTVYRLLSALAGESLLPLSDAIGLRQHYQRLQLVGRLAIFLGVLILFCPESFHLFEGQNGNSQRNAMKKSLDKRDREGRESQKLSVSIWQAVKHEVTHRWNIHMDATAALGMETFLMLFVLQSNLGVREEDIIAASSWQGISIAASVLFQGYAVSRFGLGLALRGVFILNAMTLMVISGLICLEGARAPTSIGGVIIFGGVLHKSIIKGTSGPLSQWRAMSAEVGSRTIDAAGSTARTGSAFAASKVVGRGINFLGLLLLSGISKRFSLKAALFCCTLFSTVGTIALILTASPDETIRRQGKTKKRD